MKGVEIDAVTKSHVVETLKRYWGTPTGDYVRGFIERVIDYAQVRELRPESANVARLRGCVEVLLPRSTSLHEHHRALSWCEVPDVMMRLELMGFEKGSRPPCFRFMILCGLRQSEVHGLLWGDVREVSGRFLSDQC